jgi:hypothetical protein
MRIKSTINPHYLFTIDNIYRFLQEYATGTSIQQTGSVKDCIII